MFCLRSFLVLFFFSLIALPGGALAGDLSYQPQAREPFISPIAKFSIATGLDPPERSTVLGTLSLGRKHLRFGIDREAPMTPLFGDPAEERKPEWANMRPFVGVAHQAESWTFAIEYVQKGRLPLVDRGYFGQRNKLYAAAEYRWSSADSAYLELSRGVVAGLRHAFNREFGGGDIALMYHSPPSRDLRNFFGMSDESAKWKNGTVSVVYRIRF